MKDRTFQAANQVFCGLMRDYRARGKDVSQHKAALTNADVERLYSSGTLSDKNPQTLLYKVYFELSLHCARRGCEGLRDLRRESFILCRDENGHQYVTLAYHELEKNHQGVNRKESDRDPRMYEQLNDPNCPVASFKKYVAKLNPGCDAFFQRPKTTANSDIWYVNCPIGKNKLSTMMKEISGKAQLSRVYTNHCLRVTSATVLSRNDFNLNDIRSVTGHRSVDGVLPYVEGTSDAQRYKMSKSLHRHGKATSTTVSDSPVKTPVSARPSPVADNAVDQIAAPASAVAAAVAAVTPTENSTVSVSETAVVAEPTPGPSNVIAMSSTANNINLERLTHSIFSGVTFAANSNPVFNINFN